MGIQLLGFFCFDPNAFLVPEACLVLKAFKLPKVLSVTKCLWFKSFCGSGFKSFRALYSSVSLKALRIPKAMSVTKACVFPEN